MIVVPYIKVHIPCPRVSHCSFPELIIRKCKPSVARRAFLLVITPPAGVIALSKPIRINRLHIFRRRTRRNIGDCFLAFHRPETVCGKIFCINFYILFQHKRFGIIHIFTGGTNSVHYSLCTLRRIDGCLNLFGRTFCIQRYRWCSWARGRIFLSGACEIKLANGDFFTVCTAVS